jgi:CRP-like cAMP-binding protein
MQKLIPLEEDTTNKRTVMDYAIGMDFFSELDDTELRSVTKWIRPYKANSGVTIFEEGKQEPQLCLIADGDVSIFKEISSTEHLKIADIKSGGSIGEMGILDDEAISASAIASMDSVVFIISNVDFKKMVSENQSLGVKLLWKIGKIISLRLRKTTGLLAEVSIAKSDR